MSNCCCSRARWVVPLVLLVIVAVAGWYIGKQSRSDDQPSQNQPQPQAEFKVYRNISAKVVRIDPELHSITLDHEEIPGLMGAMTMDMKADPSVALDDCKPGDKVMFDLARVSGLYQIVSIRPAPDKPATQESGEEATLAEPPLEPGDLVPDLSLVNTAGEPFQLRDLKSKRKVITFFYARCPLQEFCPAQSLRLAELQKYLNENNSDIHLVSLTLNAEFDTPSVLADYARRFKVDPQRWTLAGSENPEEIRRFANRAGAQAKLQDNGNQVDHALIALRVDGDRIVDRVYGLDAIEKLLRKM
ncbi:MAG: SCO family protein [Phycisphaerales bacterium]|nr:SCO family protein [Phycisphaerales bacterium]